MLTAVLSLTGALVFGAADFLGGLAAKRIGAVLATAVASLAGFVGLALATPLSGGEWTAADLWWGAAAGLAGAVAIGLLYACLAIGPMSILSPLTAVVSAIVPMLWDFAAGARLGPLAPWALGLALVAVVLVGFVPERGAVRPSLTGIVMGVGSGTAIGAFFILIDRTSDDSGLAPLAVNCAVTAVVMFAVVGALALRSRATQRTKQAGMPSADAPKDADPSARGRARGIRLAAVGGLVNAAANALLLFGIRAGELAVAAVLGAMYPAGTILLAAIVLKERIAPVQWAGLVLALASAAMLALA
ncbi:EamA family transporter [Agromyces sp. NPDC057679]|uniref:EamA family transporter n=1 Tax=Agromyces sp. NPDC057679 TaxID=3346207 RepID=UPI003670F908